MQPKVSYNPALIAGWLLIISGLCGIWYGATQQRPELIDLITPIIGFWGYISVLVGAVIITCGFMWPKIKLWILSPFLLGILIICISLLFRG